MDFVFWQNILSIHQAPLIRNLSRRHHVVLVVEQEIDSARAEGGWIVPDMGDAHIIVSPSKKQIFDIINSYSTATHFFTGISAFPMVYAAFKSAVSQGVSIMIHMEPYDDRGWRSWLRFFYYKWLNIIYGKNISAILATGEKGVTCYTKVGFPRVKIFEWGYFTNDFNGHESVYESEKVQVLYVGQLIERKAVCEFVKIFLSIQRQFDAELTIIGDGVQKTELLSIIGENNGVRLIPRLPNNEIQTYMKQADLLVLPSNHDGWGAVVNEAITCGTRVLCSSSCGSACLIDGEVRGSVFSWTGAGNELKVHLSKWIKKGKLDKDNRKRIEKWAKNSISGEAAANYFSLIAEYVSGEFSSTDELRPVPPWK